MKHLDDGVLPRHGPLLTLLIYKAAGVNKVRRMPQMAGLRHINVSKMSNTVRKSNIDGL